MQGAKICGYKCDDCGFICDHVEEHFERGEGEHDERQEGEHGGRAAGDHHEIVEGKHAGGGDHAGGMIQDDSQDGSDISLGKFEAGFASGGLDLATENESDDVESSSKLAGGEKVGTNSGAEKVLTNSGNEKVGTNQNGSEDATGARGLRIIYDRDLFVEKLTRKDEEEGAKAESDLDSNGLVRVDVSEPFAKTSLNDVGGSEGESSSSYSGVSDGGSLERDELFIDERKRVMRSISPPLFRDRGSPFFRERSFSPIGRFEDSPARDAR